MAILKRLVPAALPILILALAPGAAAPAHAAEAESCAAAAPAKPSKKKGLGLGRILGAARQAGVGETLLSGVTGDKAGSATAGSDAMRALDAIERGDAGSAAQLVTGGSRAADVAAVASTAAELVRQAQPAC